MNIIPAIDIKNGKCVRLFQGDFTKETVYSNDPVAVAEQWEKQGAKRLHVVDLDGAKTGKIKNIATIKSIVASVKIPVQVGGGVRNISSFEDLLHIGVEKIILGTIAIENKSLLKIILDKYADNVIVSLDVKKGKLASQGWVKENNENYYSVIAQLIKQGVQHVIYTDVNKDGTLSGPDVKGIKKILGTYNVSFFVAGGISSAEDIRGLEKIGVRAIIIGKALYEGRIKLNDYEY